ncbi:hypothetical protein BDN72DRAFT_904290 [Pluteus cervinus]|uniref:Uncharacterized protein n=1 Tax=Pluteus cervinus TaxID=181527 RepID=A0ACD3A5W1_9AGAR|nr:hypothetical protein BDN72DRAFT_904290 [Pluteus cervinus]
MPLPPSPSASCIRSFRIYHPYMYITTSDEYLEVVEIKVAASATSAAAGLPGSGCGKWKKTRRNSRKCGGLTSVDSSLGVDYDHNVGAPASGRETSVSELAGIPALPSGNGNGDITETKRASHKSKSPSSTLAQPSPIYYRSGSYTMEPIVGNGHHPTSDSRDNRSSIRQSIPLPTDFLNHLSPGSAASTSTTLLGTSPPLTNAPRSPSSRSPPPPLGTWTGGSPGAHSVFSTVSDSFGSELGHGNGGSSGRSSANASQQQIQLVAVAPSGYMPTPSSNSTTEREREGSRPRTSTTSTSNSISKSRNNRRRASVEGTGTSTGRGERDRKVPPKVPPPPIKMTNCGTSSNSHSKPNIPYPPPASRPPTSSATMKKSSSSNSYSFPTPMPVLLPPTVATSASAIVATATAVAVSTTRTPTPSTQGHVRGQSSSQQKKKTPGNQYPYTMLLI